jgi:hypothetical protein
MIRAKEIDFLKAQEQFDRICKFVDQAAEQGQRVDQVERHLFPKAMEMCLHLLQAFVESHGDGDEGPEVEVEDCKTLRRFGKPHDKRYLSIFGELVIPRWVYGVREGQAIEYVPLDAALGLPAGDNSYVFEDWLERLCVKEAYGEGVADLREWLGTTVSVRTAEGINRNLASYTEGYRLSQGIPAPEEDEEILVVSADGKGVPMRRSLEQRLRDEAAAQTPTVETSQASPEKTRSSPNISKKQMAYVGAVYSIAPFVRTADDVIDEVRRRKRSSERPRPVQKRLRAQMTRIPKGASWPAVPCLFLDLAVECYLRDPHQQKTLVCLMDGERQLWEYQKEWLARALQILDLFHAMKRLWAVAHCIHPENSPAASEYVSHHLRMLLEGKVGYVIRNFRKLIKRKHKRLRGSKRKTVESAITYYENNRERMHYDAYLAAGYPIASGVIEGACHHFVKDRMEGAGMRWELEGAQAMLSVRAIYLNGQWDDFIAYRIAKEQAYLYGEGSQPAVAA